MTKEVAKSILYVYRAVNLVDVGHREAFDMGIRSLEAWDEVQKEIYRQIDALDEIHEFRDKEAYFKALDIVNKYLKEVEHDKE